MNEKMYAIREVARVLNISKESVRKRISKGLIEAHKNGPHWRITQSELSRLIYGGDSVNARDAYERSYRNGEAAGRDSAFKEACEIISGYRAEVYEPQLQHAVGCAAADLEAKISTCRIIEKLLLQRWKE